MSLRVWLPLNGTLDNQGLDDIEISSLGVIDYNNNGKIGKAFISGGSSQTINGIKLNNNFSEMFNKNHTASIAVWIKPLGNHVHYNGTIVSSGNWNNQRWAFGVSQDNTKVDTLSEGYNIYIDCPIPVNEWTHLVSVYDNGISKVYKNGIYIGEITRDIDFNSDASFTCIGRETYANGYFGFNGLINDVRIYDHALSPMEVKQISQGLILHYPLNNNGWGQENLLINSNTERTSKNSYPFWPFAEDDIPKISGNVCTISFDAKSTVDNVACDVYFRSTTMVGQSIIVSNITTKYKRYSVTMTAPTSTFVSICIRNNYNVPGASTTATYSYKNIKVELG